VSVAITEERPDRPDVAPLVEELEAHLASLYPAESRHGFSVQKLIDQGVVFYVIRVDGEPAGCGGVKLFGTEFGELKRMYVRPPFRGRGFGKLLIDTLTAHAARRGIKTMRLETGIYQEDAIRLYEREGFRRIEPFANYKYDPVSLCFEKNLE
jgi:GNAT superfamily N-acetyltransferase